MGGRLPSVVKLPAQIKAVTFDAGGTLIRPSPSVGQIYADAAARHGAKDISAELLSKRFTAAWAGRREFAYTRGDWAQLVDETFQGLVEPPPSRSFFTKLYDRFAQAGCWRIFDDVHPALEALALRGLKLGIVSNWDERLRPLLRELKLHDYFGAIAISCEVGVTKPSRLIFQRVAEELRFPAQSILHVGDNRVEDLHGAFEADFHALLLRRGTNAAKSDEIGTLRELHS